MKEIKAFVGHSFNKQDAEVVGAFLKYFTQLTELVPNFSWDHAEAAEPVELADKVKRKFAEANTFIGICTTKEYAVSEEKLSTVLFHPRHKKAEAGDLHAFSSEWVTQEIGYALGRGLPLILLQETGIRRPGGLQGDLNFIPFERARPELAFGQILEMLSALSPTGTAGGATGDAPKSDDAGTEATQDGTDWTTAQHSWIEADYRRAILHLTALGDTAKADAVFAAYAISDIGKQGSRTAELAAHQEFIKILFGKEGSLDRIAGLANANPGSANILSSLARAYIQFDNHDGAAKTYEKAAALDRNSKDGLYYLGRAAVQYAKAGQSAKAHALFDEVKTNSGADKDIERKLAEAIGDYAEGRKDEESPVIALERQVDLAPDDYNARFQLAYKHSQLGNEDLSLYHYLKIPHDARDAITWNNLGVAYDHFKMRVASVSAYRRSEDMGETLAMSNLGYKFMKAGFREEAKASFDKGFAVQNHSANVEEGLSALTKISDEEDAKQKDALEKSSPKVEFYRNLGTAIAAPQLKTLATHIQARENTALAVTLSGDTFKAVGKYEVDSALGGLFSGAGEKREYRIEYIGNITGRFIEATVSRVQTSGPKYNSLLSLADDKSKVLMWADDSGVLRAMENPHSTMPTFYLIKPTENGQVAAKAT